MPHDQKANSVLVLDRFVLIGCVVFTLVLVASHWFFMENLHHRIGGVAWNALFQIFGNLFAGFASLGIIVTSFTGKISRRIGIPSALLLGLTAGYCLFRSFGVMMSI